MTRPQLVYRDLTALILALSYISSRSKSASMIAGSVTANKKNVPIYGVLGESADAAHAQ